MTIDNTSPVFRFQLIDTGDEIRQRIDAGNRLPWGEREPRLNGVRTVRRFPERTDEPKKVSSASWKRHGLFVLL